MTPEDDKRISAELGVPRGPLIPGTAAFNRLGDNGKEMYALLKRAAARLDPDAMLERDLHADIRALLAELKGGAR